MLLVKKELEHEEWVLVVRGVVDIRIYLFLEKVMKIIIELKIEMVYIEDIFVINRISARKIIVLSQLLGALKMLLRGKGIKYRCYGITATYWRRRRNGIGKLFKDKGMPSKNKWNHI